MPNINKIERACDQKQQCNTRILFKKLAFQTDFEFRVAMSLLSSLTNDNMEHNFSSYFMIPCGELFRIIAMNGSENDVISYQFIF